MKVQKCEGVKVTVDSQAAVMTMVVEKEKGL